MPHNKLPVINGSKIAEPILENHCQLNVTVNAIGSLLSRKLPSLMGEIKHWWDGKWITDPDQNNAHRQVGAKPKAHNGGEQCLPRQWHKGTENTHKYRQRN
jgi:hypothetical protein